MENEIEGEARRVRRELYKLLLALGVALSLAGCAGGDDDGLREPPDFVFQVTSGTRSTTARPERTTELPFNSTIEVELIFEEPVFASGGRTAIRVTTEPTFWRVEPRVRNRPDDNTYPFVMTNNEPGTVVVTVQVDPETEPVEFTLQIGEEE